VIAAAVVFFVLFVSAQALRDWPIGDLNLGGGDDSAAVSPAQSLGGPAGTNPAVGNLTGPITATPAGIAPAGKAAGADKAGGRNQGTGKVSGETRIEGGRGVQSAPVQQPSSTTPVTPAPSAGSSPSPGGSGTASPAPSSGGGSAPSTGGGDTGSPPQTGNVGTRTAKRVTNTVNEISSAATPPAPSPVTNTVKEVEERVEPTPPPSGSTVDRIKGAVGNIGN
jgi:hypothetical protein